MATSNHKAYPQRAVKMPSIPMQGWNLICMSTPYIIVSLETTALSALTDQSSITFTRLPRLFVGGN